MAKKQVDIEEEYDDSAPVEYSTDYSTRMRTGMPTIDIITTTPDSELRKLTYDEFMKDPMQIFKRSVSGLSIGCAVMLIGNSGFGKTTLASNISGGMIKTSKAKVIYYQTEAGAIDEGRICDAMGIDASQMYVSKTGDITQAMLDKYTVIVIPPEIASVEHLKMIELRVAEASLVREKIRVKSTRGDITMVDAPIIWLVDSITSITTIERDERNQKVAESNKVKDAEALNQEDLKIGKAFKDYLDVCSRHWVKSNFVHFFLAHKGEKSTMGGMPPVREFKNMKNTDTWKGPKKTPFYCGLVLSGTRFTETKTEKIAEKLGEAANDGINYNSITAWSIIKNRLGPDVAETTLDFVHEIKYGVLADKSFMMMLMDNPLMSVCDLKGSMYTTKYYVKPDGSPKAFYLKNFSSLFSEDADFRTAVFKRLGEKYFGKWCFSNYNRSTIMDLVDSVFDF